MRTQARQVNLPPTKSYRHDDPYDRHFQCGPPNRYTSPNRVLPEAVADIHTILLIENNEGKRLKYLRMRLPEQRNASR
ncbi:hypothetical protein SDC9_112402 [bioreactor metagenome]|uniref:Uncharacterized protein n=1 Tax=bioreactor metagenome TaxID=1076179 RepID=A0A645BJD5_9ZZZZ